MSHLKSKSEINISAAEVLLDKHTYYASSVHCSYYGCFQFIRSKLNQIGITYEKIDQDIASSRQSEATTLHSHLYPIKLILDEIEKKSDKFYRSTLRNKIFDLKEYREISDYRNVDVGYDESNKAFNLSKEIIKLISSKI